MSSQIAPASRASRITHDRPPNDYLKAMRITPLIQEMSANVRPFDVLIAPAAPTLATKIDQRIDLPPPACPTRPPPPACGQSSRWGNLAGLPALVLPCGFASNCRGAAWVVVPFSENLLLVHRPAIPVRIRMAQKD